MFSVGSNQLRVDVLNLAVYGNILTEIRIGYGLAFLSFNQLHVWLKNDAIAVGVTDQETKLDIAVRLTVAVNILWTESHNLGRSHPSNLCDHAVPARS